MTVITPHLLAMLAQIYASRADQQAVLLGLLEGLVMHGGRCFPQLSGADLERLETAGLIESSGRRIRLRKPDERPKKFTDDICAAYLEIVGQPYLFSARDGVALAEMLRRSSEAEVLRRWWLGLSGAGWRQCATVAQLLMKWNDLVMPSATLGGQVNEGDVF